MQPIKWEYYPRVTRTPIARAFVERLALRDKRPKTIDAYARNVDDLIRVFEGAGAPLIEATRADIDRYIADLRDRPRPKRACVAANAAGIGLTTATIRQRVTTARLFYDYCLDCGARHDPTNPVPQGTYVRGQALTGHRSPVRHLQPPPWIPGDDEWERFITVVLERESLRNQVMVLLAYDGALRREELVSLRVSDIDWVHQSLTIRPETTKSGRFRVVFFGDAARILLARYVQTERHTLLVGFGGDRGGPLFLSESPRNTGQPLSLYTWNDVIESLRARTGLPFKTHTFRHLRLTDLQRCGLELYEIALYAGHRSIASTQLYVHLAPVHLAQHVRAATRHLDERIAHLIRHGRQEHE